MPTDPFFSRFDEDTLLKLSLFRGYIREWLPVFLTNPNYAQSGWNEILIIDGFSGPGKDSEGHQGSPSIILDEIRNYYSEHQDIASPVQINIVFNDCNPEHIRQLSQNVQDLLAEIKKYHQNTSLAFKTLPFDKFWQEYESQIKQPSPCLVILDQYGMKAVTREVFQTLTGSQRTDFLFFVPSSYFKRFGSVDVVQNIVPFDISDIQDIEHSDVHEFICEKYRGLISDDATFYLAPFSIQQNRPGNIYGIIFGSGNLLGLEKFLKVAWDNDEMTGGRNFSRGYEADMRQGQQLFSFCPDKPEKIAKFEKELLHYIETVSPNNNDLYRFALEHGFAMRVLKSILQEFLESRKIIIENADPSHTIRRGSFYLAWDHYKIKDRGIKVIYKRSSQNG